MCDERVAVGAMSTSKWMIRLGMMVLTLMLTACGGLRSMPSPDLVKQALALELTETQQVLRQQLRLDPDAAGVTLDRVKVSDRESLAIDELPGFRIQGTYDFTVQLPDRRISRQANPFEIYLQRQPETNTWQIARLDSTPEGEAVWLTHPLSAVDASEQP
jgi:hypothetical protein